MPLVSSASAATKLAVKRSAAASSNSAYRYRKPSRSCPSAVSAATDRPRGMCAGAVIDIRTGPPYPDQGASVTLPRLVSMHVSHTNRPIARSANRIASPFTATGHHAGARPSAPAEARRRGACLSALVWLVTSASSAERSPAAVRGSAVTVAMRVWFPVTPRRPGSRTLTGTVILIARDARRCAAFHRLMVAISAVTSVSFTVAPGARGMPGTGSRRSP